MAKKKLDSSSKKKVIKKERLEAEHPTALNSHFHQIVSQASKDHLIQVNLQLFQLMGIIDQLPLHRRRALDIDPVDAGNAAQPWLDPLFRIPLDKNGRGGRVQGITQKWPVLLLVGAAGRDDRIGHILGQARPGLPDNGRGLKANHVNIGMMIQFHRDFPITIPRGRGHPANATDPRQHGLQFRGRLHLDCPRGIAIHLETDRKLGQLA